MKRILMLALVLAISISALYLVQRRKHSDAVSPAAMLNVAADWQHDASRAPMRLTRLSDAEEIKIGRDLADRYSPSKTQTSAKASAFAACLTVIGNKVAAHAKRRLPYQFHLLPDVNLINAFALPGGQIFVGQGLLNQVTSEDELAFILGHEIEHVDHYHAAERVQIEAQMKHLDLDAIAPLAQIPISLWQAGYSKDEEMEADREGLRLAAKAGYSPDGAIKMLERLKTLESEYVIHAETPQDELSQVAIEGLIGYFRSHPLPSERLAQAERVISEDHLDRSIPLRKLPVG